MRTEDRAKALAKVEKLAQIARELRAGRVFMATRLTVLKNLCQDPVATARFSLYLTECNRYEAKKHLQRTSRRLPERVYQVLQELHESQNEIEHQRWADVRIIRCREALLAEYMLRCITQPWASAYWGYRMATFYADRYDPQYGTGLIPESAPAVDDIVRFWRRHYQRTIPAGRGDRRLSASRTHRRSPRHGAPRQ